MLCFSSYAHGYLYQGLSARFYYRKPRSQSVTGLKNLDKFIPFLILSKCTFASTWPFFLCYSMLSYVLAFSMGILTGLK